ncbi:WAT1-related protein At4g30420 isoform X1 [Beta vulgaris subsp. vulgaris]|uniref:WAT1-related protein At4g30420 isoform X1 n=1 Tax=Beta vulgaris subsp. vulgaris TaxID=3555 RepID=UPI002036DEB2|nr:WAT1-related protein At4g30420 isoform X1 [Beta vulgaris subsp. vulgaris]
MGRYEDQLPAIVMVLLQCVYAIMALLNRAALVKGMSPRVFMFYRQAIATLVMSPVAFFARGKSTSCSMGFRTFLLIFVTAFVGVVLNQTMYFEGLYMASSSIASAMSNLVPAVTFLTAAIMGLEQVHVKKLSSLAKMLGTAFCVIGAGCMALLRGPKLLNVQLPPAANSVVLKSFGGDDTWLLGCLFIFASMCCWSFWLILQVPLTACYPNHLSLSAWMCFLSMLQSGAIALLLERDPAAWNLSSNLELTCCFFSGIFGSGVQFFAQAWCISRRGPLYSAMFNPLCTVITTVMACIFLHEELYVGSILGAAAVIIGLYTVLLGKAREMKEKLLESEDFVSNPSKAAQEKASFKIDDLEQPLLADICNDQV